MRSRNQNPRSKKAFDLRSQISDLKIDGSRIQDPKHKDRQPNLSTFQFFDRLRTYGFPLSTIWKTAALLLVFVFQISCSDHRVFESPRPRVTGEQASPVRIISLAPSVTEILFELGLGEKVVGVTRYCDYPPEVLEKPKVGGYLDVNYEAVLSLAPDLVIHIAQHEEARDRLRELGIATLAVDHSRVDGILDSITTIGNRCTVPEKSRALRRELEGKMQEVQLRSSSVSPRPRVPASAVSPPLPLSPSPPRVLVAVGPRHEPRASGEIYVSGRDGFYDDLIRLAGGQNAYSDETLKFPALSAEGIARIDPGVIIEMIPDLTPDEDMPALLSRWNDIPGLRAVKNGNVHILGGDYVVIPGPRFVTLLEEMAGLIHESGSRVESGKP